MWTKKWETCLITRRIKKEEFVPQIKSTSINPKFTGGQFLNANFKQRIKNQKLRIQNLLINPQHVDKS